MNSVSLLLSLSLSLSHTHTHTHTTHDPSLTLLQMDWSETEASLEKLQRDLAHSWEHLRAIAKHESFTDSISTEKKMKSAQFLAEASERLKVLEVVHRRVKNRFNRLLLYLGMNTSQAEQQKV